MKYRLFFTFFFALLLQCFGLFLIHFTNLGSFVMGASNGLFMYFGYLIGVSNEHN